MRSGIDWPQALESRWLIKPRVAWVKHGFKPWGAVCRWSAYPRGERAIIQTMAIPPFRPILVCGLLLAGATLAADREPRDEPRADRVERVRPPTTAEVVDADRRRQDHWHDPSDPRAGRFPRRAQQSEHERRSGSDLQQAIEHAQSRYGGKVLSASRISYPGEDRFRVKLLTNDGRVRVIQMGQSDLAPSEQSTKRAPASSRRIDTDRESTARPNATRPQNDDRQRSESERRPDRSDRNFLRQP